MVTQKQIINTEITKNDNDSEPCEMEEKLRIMFARRSGFSGILYGEKQH